MVKRNFPKYENHLNHSGSKNLLSCFWPKFAQKNFLKNLAPSHFEHCHFASLCKKSEKNNESTLRKAIFSYLVKGNFPQNTKIRFLRRIRIIREKPLQPFFRESCPPSLYKKSEKREWQDFAQSPKNPIFRQFLAQICPNKFFLKNRAPSRSGHCHFASLCKKSEKTNEPILRKAGNRRTNERTDGHGLI
mgnify:CR=1 FL=1